MSQAEALMYVALGAVLAMMLVFAFGRSVWSLSNLYARRKRDKDLPATMLELQAEKNRLRAEHAMMNRKLEVGTEEMKAKVVTQMAEVARHRNRLLGMAESLDENTVELESRTAETASLQERLDESVNDLIEHKKTIGALQDTLSDRDRSLADGEIRLSEKTQTIVARDARIYELETEIVRLGVILETTVTALDESNQHAAELETTFLDMQTHSRDNQTPAPRLQSEFEDIPVMQPPNKSQPFNNFETRRRIAEIAAKAAAGPPPTIPQQGPLGRTPATRKPTLGMSNPQPSTSTFGLRRSANPEDAAQPDEFKSLITEARVGLAQTVQTDETTPPGTNEKVIKKSGAFENVVSLAQRIRALQKKNDEKLTKNLK